MSKITKSDLLNFIQEQADMLAELTKLVELNKRAIIKLENVRENPQLKQVDQSVFNGLDSKWIYAAVDGNGTLKAFTYKPKLAVSRTGFILLIGSTMDIGTGYDASDWRDSLIKRDIAKELLEVNLSSELTGNELCKAMLARGDRYVMCFVNDKCEEAAKNYKRVRVIHSHGIDYFDDTTEDMWDFAVPINSQGEPLTAIDVGI